ncbi:hypothetical protein BBJ28_00002724 [Nothophytophthora sp. Chile5]|nr:hypothetical protein BBJ28_00002724 [Nothophytophthora sp. Chile5]
MEAEATKCAADRPIISSQSDLEASKMLQSGAIRSLFRNAVKVSATRPAASAGGVHLLRPSASSSPLAASMSFRFGTKSAFVKSMQTQSFASVPSHDDRKKGGKSPQQQIQELLAENAALKKEVETLKTEAAKKPNKFLGTLQQYGMPFLFWWTGLYFASGLAIYGALDFGLISGASVIDFIMQLGLDKFVDPQRLDPTYGNIAIAIIVNECLEVVRFPITLATLPYVKRVFSRGKVEEAK